MAQAEAASTSASASRWLASCIERLLRACGLRSLCDGDLRFGQRAGEDHRSFIGLTFAPKRIAGALMCSCCATAWELPLPRPTGGGQGIAAVLRSRHGFKGCSRFPATHLTQLVDRGHL